MARSAGPRKCPEFFRFTVACTVLAAANVAQSEPMTLSGGLTSRFTDNAARTSSNETSDTETRASLTLAHQTDPGDCEARTAAELGYGVWQDDTFDPRNYVALDFDGDCEIVRGLSWDVSDNLRHPRQPHAQERFQHWAGLFFNAWPAGSINRFRKIPEH